MKISSREYTRSELHERIGNLAQLGGTRHVILNDGASKGLSAIDVETGTGLHFTVLPDRGMDISRASYRGLNLVYLTPNGEVNPAFYDPEGLEWLHTFFGGLMTTCGLTYLGSPGLDGEDHLGLHGRYSTIPARQVQDRSGWEEDAYVIKLVGTVEQCRLFGDNLRLTRTITTELGSNALQIIDIVENVGYATSPFTILYHINAGFPLLDASSRLVLTATDTEPYDEQSRKGMTSFTQFSPPKSGFEEENYLHTMAQAGDGLARAAMLNPDLADGIGLQIRFDTSTLPYLNEWKMMGQRDYVVGIEPCNAPCANRAVLREEGRLPVLEPGEQRKMTLEISVLDGADQLNACAQACRLQ